MSDFAVMPKVDYIEACDTIRAKTGDTCVIKSGELAGKVNDVYNAGQISVLRDSKYMYPTVSGEVIRIDDMSSVPHKVRIAKRSDIVVDLETVKVYKYGKNLYCYSNIADVVVTAEGAIRRGVEIPFSESITVSCGSIAGNSEVYIKTLIDGSYSALVSLNANRTYTFSGNGTLILYATSDRFFDNVTNLQVELGDTATEYEAHIEPVEVGETVDSTPNTITLLPNTSGVILDCQYLRDIDRYIDKCFKEQ